MDWQTIAVLFFAPVILLVVAALKWVFTKAKIDIRSQDWDLIQRLVERATSFLLQKYQVSVDAGAPLTKEELVRAGELFYDKAAVKLKLQGYKPLAMIAIELAVDGIVKYSAPSRDEKLTASEAPKPESTDGN